MIGVFQVRTPLTSSPKWARTRKRSSHTKHSAICFSSTRKTSTWRRHGNDILYHRSPFCQMTCYTIAPLFTKWHTIPSLPFLPNDILYHRSPFCQMTYYTIAPLFAKWCQQSGFEVYFWYRIPAPLVPAPNGPNLWCRLPTVPTKTRLESRFCNRGV